MFVALLTFFSASPPRKPMRVILLRYIRFSCSARLSRAPGSEWARLPRPEAAFLGGPARGNQNRNGAEGKAEASQAPGAARAPKQCRDKGWNRKRTGKQFRHVLGGGARLQGNVRTRLNERSRRNSRGTVGAGQHPGARLRRLSPPVAMVKTAQAWQRGQSGGGNWHWALTEFIAHFHSERNHQGKGNVLLFPARAAAYRRRTVRCRERLGGLLRYYCRAA